MGPLIYIYGPRKLQNELLASFLGREIGARCFVGINFKEAGTEDKGNDPSKLILIDCQGREPDECLASLDEDQQVVITRGCPAAFFNVKNFSQSEKRILEQGIRGFFYEEDSLESLSKGIQSILNGELWVSREVLTKFVLENKKGGRFAGKAVSELTHRETEILALIATGINNEEIADKLCISPNTVKTHIYNIFKKIGVPNRFQAALWAVKNL